MLGREAKECGSYKKHDDSKMLVRVMVMIHEGSIPKCALS